MVRIANTNKRQSKWHQSEIDPDVRYLIEPLLNQERIELGNYTPRIVKTRDKNGETFLDVTWITTNLFRATLRKTEGILDPDNDNKELEFKFTSTKISKRLTVEMCQREIYNKIPSDLLDEILLIMNDDNTISEEEDDDINFTSDSPSEISSDHAETATETTTDASLKVMDTESESEQT